MAKDNNEFDFQKALKAIQSGKPLTGKRTQRGRNTKGSHLKY
jgi:hypothetical protein